MVPFRDNNSMNDTSTTFDLLDDPATIVADRQAVQEFAEKGTPIDPTVLHRVRARANRVREKTRERFGIVNIDELLRPSTYDDE